MWNLVRVLGIAVCQRAGQAPRFARMTAVLEPAIVEPVAPPDSEPVTLEEQHAFNLARWEQILADPGLARYEFRVESDRYGRAILMPPPAPEHGEKQAEIGFLLRTLLPHGRVTVECPSSTREGVKAADVTWSTRERQRAQRGRACLTQAPEICVEVISPSNSRREMREKKALYFEAGAEEVWFCHRDGRMEFFLRDAPDTPAASSLCPAFSPRIELET